MAPPPGYNAASVWHKDFPPRELIDNTTDPETDEKVEWRKRGKVQDKEAVAQWFEQHVPSFEPQPMTTEEQNIYRMDAMAYVTARKAGKITCELYARVLVKRMVHLEALNCFMVTSYQLRHKIIEQAVALDAKAEAEGIESIAPLYGLPIPVKGTCATADFPSCVGCGVLQNCFAKKDSELCAILKAAGAVLMGKTNVPEFACSGTTLNHTNGVCRNPYDAALSTGGSSGGSAVATASRIAPLSITEDTGGSTRNPANQCGNFGYDPPRNKHPNAGNPGITFFRDQLGCNAHSFDDILLYDLAVTGKADEHAAAASAVAAIPASAIKIGCPQEMFVEYNIPQSVRQHDEINKPDKDTGERPMGPDIKASPSILSKISTARASLEAAGFSVLDKEWGEVTSDKLGTVNALYHMQWGWEAAPGKHWSGGLSTLTGQMAMWINEYLDTDVNVADITDDVRPVGSHNPAGGMASSAENGGSESEFRMTAIVQAECTDLWNTYFDQHDIDFILTPSLWGDVTRYTEGVRSVKVLNVKQADGSYAMEEVPKGVGAFWGFAKLWAVPKMLVPLGVDELGRPVSCTCWGRAVPRESLYDDESVKTFDLEFLYKVRRAVQTMHAVPELCRQEPQLNDDIFGPPTESATSESAKL